MNRTPKITFNHVAATLCLAVTLMIVGFQSVTLADRFGHSSRPDHVHDIIEAQLLVAEVEHSDHHVDDADNDLDADGPVGGAHHHHHADGVGSFVVTRATVDYGVMASTVQLAATGDATPFAWTPAGIERPPRTLTTRI